MAEVTFCEECNNILYARSDRKNKKLLYVCRSCDYISHKPNDQQNIVARINYNYNRKEDVYIHPETKNDPALGRVREWVCKSCGNNEAVFLQLPERISSNPMALIYVCTGKNCQYWEKEIQITNDEEDPSQKSARSSVGSHVGHLNAFVKQEAGHTQSIISGQGQKRSRKKLKKVGGDHDDSGEEEEHHTGGPHGDGLDDGEEKEEDKLKKELQELINAKDNQHLHPEDQHSEVADFVDENESDVEDYF
ncbi:DNA-directed RNA polymerase 2 subunit, putative [Plasmodium knowlesi strain H]|uniref:DNA-directed RNA polymerase 2 subunit, putative n=3 Tax=Plasmodium knowlesi TaxID=5850 RepID=A0A5K1V5J3_PLAKH|nr:DNA-directed RNA polymerase II subunit RPB9, putative [Plasmodium knowlesi strain H]OTN66485.1 putative DNA-directed RNA polymerase 2 subunit [Plasmodium knowlesi]CAA9986300.1 DNA-directed RNA polymerase II subunit RPB9, putative [Plasmodium knowlesi strain H]SBO25529.1 DNA-directed RNA polymerase 2 subunit, putative [Plasmodium knowlesi strain H]SBO28284.1 DNA-directed RNA polymerase 2 subunit, putative [Plasmodium knowlesi strain H]VVS75774.1 DNA-directed RNA polymerase II subunit RPB9, p|eukprot:XP_002257706.1 dna-directed rna polymerase 2 subunit, putative [Plasmodium knowlesi strain H]